MSKKSFMFSSRSDSLSDPQDGPALSPPTHIPVSEHQPAHSSPPSEPFPVHDTPHMPDSSSAKRSRGRPRKQKNVAEFDTNGSAQPVFVALGLADEPLTKRHRGRPKKYLSDDSPISVPPLQQVSMKKRGRPAGSGKKAARPSGDNQSALVAISSSGDPLTPRRGRGRPKGSRNSGPRRSSGRPIGRPRINPVTPVRVSTAAYEDMKRKLDYMQKKVLQATGILKPEFGRQSSVMSIAAIQELENLAELDIDGPWDMLPPVAASTADT